MKKYFILCLLLCNLMLFSQRPVVSQNVKKNSDSLNWGENRRHHIAGNIGLGFIFGNENKGAEIYEGNSIEYTIGLNYKLKITNHEAIGFKLSYVMSSYKLNPPSVFDTTLLKNIINNNDYIKEKMNLNTLSFGFYNRINFDKRRGNTLGYYLDLGIDGNLMIAKKHFTRNNIDGHRVSTYITKVKYVNDFNYNAYVAIGLKSFVIFYKHRLSDIFKNEYPQFPESVLGLKIEM